MTTADDLNNAGLGFMLQGQSDAAQFHFNAALRINPFHIPALANAVVNLGRLEKLSAAIGYARRILTLLPNDGGQWCNLSNLLLRSGQHIEAETAAKKAVELAPENPSVWRNYAIIAYQMGKHLDAQKYLETVMALGQRNPEVLNDLAHVYLARGHLAKALELYENRWERMVHLKAWDFYIPEWQGEILHGKRILFHGEQGMGDTIMTARFYKDLVAEGAKVTIGIPNKELVSLFEHQNWGCEIVHIESLPENSAELFDFHSPMYGAMRHLKIEIGDIKSAPYMSAPEITTLPTKNGFFNVGICWGSGKRNNEFDWRRRYAALENWLPLASIPGVYLWSLQKGEDAEDISRLNVEGLVDDSFISDVTEWAETAAFISKLDLVISVDTAMVHLAGALGVPCWMLAQHTPCWRWWDIENGTGKPWYDWVEIFKQKEYEGWKPQLEYVKQILEAHLEVRNLKREIAA